MWDYKTRDFPLANKNDLKKEQLNKSVLMTLNRPQSSNAFTDYMIYSMHANLLAIEKQRNVDMVIIKSQGNKVFSTGIDVQETLNKIKDYTVTQRFHRDIDDSYRILHEISNMATPTVTIMDGLTTGLGAGIAFCSTFRIATENTVIRMPETAIGHFTDSSTSYFLSRLNNNYGTYLALSGASISAHDIMNAGIATHYVPSSKIQAMIKHLTRLSSPILKDIDGAINQFTEKWPINSLNATMDVSRDTTQTMIASCFGFNTIEEIITALESQGSAFSKNVIKNILKASPTALKITLELLRRASTLSLVDCLVLERQLWNLDMISRDFKEGCRAKVSKQAPQWHPKYLSGVDLETTILDHRFEKARSWRPIYLRYIIHSEISMLAGNPLNKHTDIVISSKSRL